MAAKARAAHAGKKSTASRQASKSRARPRGLQLSSAQARAYNKAFNATTSRLRNAATVRAFATGLRKYRLQAAHTNVRKYQVVRASAQAASIAAHASSMSLAQSVVAHQNLALQRRIGADAFRHTTLLGRIQFAQGGEKRFAHRAVMRTLTQAQAVGIEVKFVNKVRKNLRRTSKKSARGTPLSKSITAAGKAAGLAAANAKGRAANRKTNARAAAASAKAPVKTAKSRTAPRIGEAMRAASADPPAYAQAMAGWTGYAAVNSQPAAITRTGSRQEWVGNEFTPNCIVTAIANHMLHTKSVRVTQKEIEELTELAGEEPTIEGVLWKVYLTGWPGRDVHLETYREVEDDEGDRENLVIGFEALTDDGWNDHCALSREDSRVVSWGAEADRESLVEEAWELTWRVLRT